MSEGPYFDELQVGRRFAAVSGVTLDDGAAAIHRSIVGDRLALALDEPLARAVAGGARIAHPALVWDVAIGQSTVATQHVKANLFYRGLSFRRVPVLGDTLYTTTSVAALRQNRARDDRPATGLAALRITTVDQQRRPVLDFWRCAMLPLRDANGHTGHDDDLDAVGRDTVDAEDAEDAGAPGLVGGWDLAPFAERGAWPRAADLSVGDTIDVAGGDVVSSAPELARLTLNVARVHHDAAAGGGRRLVYGGHTIGIAMSQACRALPGVLTVVGWHSCEHTGPVHEGDVLRSSVEVERIHPVESAAYVHLRSRVVADDEHAGERRPVLDWRYVAVLVA